MTLRKDYVTSTRTDRDNMAENDEIPWEGKCVDEAATFARKCAELKRTNPYDFPALDRLMNDLMTELWDNGFSQTEIRSAFETAVADIPRYGAGEERRGDKSRSKEKLTKPGT